MADTKVCECCGKSINILLRICPFCGAEVKDTKEKREPLCPRCSVNLETFVHKGEEYDICPRCGGLWLDRDEFERATSESNVYRDEGIKGEFVRKAPDDQIKYIPCVRCGKLMMRKNFRKISGIIIDECGMHGVWLDEGELEKIRQFIAKGGLERSQNMEIDALRAELQDLDIKVDKTASLIRLLHFFNLKRWIFG